MITIIPGEFSTDDLKTEEEWTQLFLEIFYKKEPNHSFQDQFRVFASAVPSGFFVYILHNDWTWSCFEVKISTGKKWRTSDV